MRQGQNINNFKRKISQCGRKQDGSIFTHGKGPGKGWRKEDGDKREKSDQGVICILILITN